MLFTTLHVFFIDPNDFFISVKIIVYFCFNAIVYGNKQLETLVILKPESDIVFKAFESL